MQAASDSNLSRMAELWGTRAGPASKTGQPPDYARRITIMQFYLSGSPYRLVPGGAAEVEPAGGGHTDKDRLPGPANDANNTRQVVVQLDRPGCSKLVPFSVVKTADNTWVINQVDLVAAGNPKRPCPPEKTGRDSTTRDST